MKRAFRLAVSLLAIAICGAATPATAGGNGRAMHSAYGKPPIAGGLHVGQRRRHGFGHRGMRPAFKFAGYGHAALHRHNQIIVINNRVVVETPKVSAAPSVADLPVVVGIRRPPVSDPVIHQLGRSFNPVGSHSRHHHGNGWHGEQAQRQSLPRQARWAESPKVESGARIIIVRGR